MLAPTQFDVAFGTQTLTTMVRSFMDAPVGSRVCTSIFEAGRPIQVLPGNTAVWDTLTGRRHLAGFVGESSPHVQVAQVGQTPKTSAMAWIKLYKDIPGVRLFDQRAPGQLMPGADAVIRYELQDLANMLGDTRERMCALLLSAGTIVGSTANFPGSQVIFTVDFGASSNGAFTRSAAWSTSTTKIISTDLVSLKKTYRDTCGAEPGMVIGNTTIEADFLKNSEFQELVKYTVGNRIAQVAGQLEGKLLPELRVGGMDWLVASGTFKPEGGSVTSYFPDDYVAVLPAMDNLQDTLGMARGHGIVPTGPVFIPDAAGGASGLQVASTPGAYSYAEIRGEIPGVRIYAGDVFLPVILDPTKLMRGAA